MVNAEHAWCYVIDDDELVGNTVAAIAQEAGFHTRSFTSGIGFLDELDHLVEGVSLLDVRMPGVDGMEVLEILRARWPSTPVLMVSGYGDIPLAVSAMQRGASSFIEKPLDPDALIDLLVRVRSGEILKFDAPGSYAVGKNGLSALSEREIEVLRLLVMGDQNKMVARKLGISPRTVEVHRARIMQRLEVKSFAEMVRLAIQSGLELD